MCYNMGIFLYLYMSGDKEKPGLGGESAKSGEVDKPNGETGEVALPAADGSSKPPEIAIATGEQLEAERVKALNRVKKKLDKGEKTVQFEYGGDFFRMRDLPGLEKSGIKSEFHVTLPDMNDPKYKGKKMRVFMWFPQNGAQNYDDFISRKIYESVMEARRNGEPIALVVNRDFEAGYGHTNWNAFRNPETYSAMIDHVEKMSGERRLANNVSIGASSGGYKGIAHVLQNLKKNIEEGIRLKSINRNSLDPDAKAKLDAELEKCERDNALYAGIRRVGLFDSLYGYEEDFSAWATSDPKKRLFSYWGTSDTTPNNKKLKKQVEDFYLSKGLAVPATKTVYAAPHIGHDVGVNELAAFLREDISSSKLAVPRRKTDNIPINVSVDSGKIPEITPSEAGPVRVRLPVSVPPSSDPLPISENQPPADAEPVQSPTATAQVPISVSRKSYGTTTPPPSAEGAKSAPLPKTDAPLPSVETPPDEGSALTPDQLPKTDVSSPETAETSQSEGPIVYKPGNEKPVISELKVLRAGILDEYNRSPTELFTNYPPDNPRANLDTLFGSEESDIKKYIITIDPLSDPNNPKPITFLGRKIHGGINLIMYLFLKIAEELIMKTGVNYMPAGKEVLGFNYRNMMFNGKPDKLIWSFHKPGLAVDLDHNKNGPKDFRGNIPDQVVMGMVKAGYSWGLVKTDDEPYFSQDAMHFQPRYHYESPAGQAKIKSSNAGRRYWAVIKPMIERIKAGQNT